MIHKDVTKINIFQVVKEIRKYFVNYIFYSKNSEMTLTIEMWNINFKIFQPVRNNLSIELISFPISLRELHF